MSQYYKPLENLNVEDTIKFVSIGAAEEGKFGPQHQCEVTVNGEQKTWTLSDIKLKQFTEGGFKSGDTVRVQKWKEGVKKGYNFKAANKSNPYSQPEIVTQDKSTGIKEAAELANAIGEAEGRFGTSNVPTPPMPTSEVINETPRDDFQDKVSRGASWNNAFAYCLEHKVAQESFVDFMKRVTETAEQIQPYQQKFVNR